ASVFGAQWGGALWGRSPEGRSPMGINSRMRSPIVQNLDETNQGGLSPSMINPDLTVDLHNHIIDNQTFDCICGKTYKTQAGLKQHQRRYCDGQFSDYNCTICGKVWTKKQSLNQHMRHRHPTEYNLTMKEEASRTLYKQWFPREIEEMAEAEARNN
ncbi:suppressor of Hairy wing, partial [Carabus blaptoides fortunei]